MSPHRLFCALLALSASGQTFEVASIKPNAENDNRIMMRLQPGGRFVATGVTLRDLIGYAYNVRNFQISGGPGWITSDRFDINAKAEEGSGQPTPDQMRAMMKALLQERFKLKIKDDTKEMPVYALVAAKNGPKLTKAEGSSAGPGGMIRMGRGELNGKGMTMARLAQQLGQQLGRTVVDKTGIEGEYDIVLKWTPEPGEGMMMRRAAAPDALPPADNSGPTIYTALQEQLGLRLESSKGPVPVLVVESAEKPSEN